MCSKVPGALRPEERRGGLELRVVVGRRAVVVVVDRELRDALLLDLGRARRRRGVRLTPLAEGEAQVH